jgi:hypothetical protein
VTVPGFGSPILSMDDLQAVTLGLTVLAAVLLAAMCWALRRR